MKLEEQTSHLHIDDTADAAPSPEGETPPPETNTATSSASKPKRVRTGCLTCRERHLKCDEGMPTCLNCKKSNRECKRGVRLNFIDTKVEDTQLIPPGADWKISFQDESREIAADYKGGAGRYAVIEPDDNMDVKPDNYAHAHEQTDMPPAPVMSHQELPPMISTPPEMPTDYPVQEPETRHESLHHSHPSNASSSSNTVYTPSESSYTTNDTLVNPEPRAALTTPEEVLFMQVFIEEVGIWMDSMDRHKHVSTA